jgi:putative restriction endonuclease
MTTDPRTVAQQKHPDGIPNGITRKDVLAAIRKLDARVKHGFDDSWGYDLVYKNRRYPPEAVLGIAAERLTGRFLRPNEFAGGQSSKSTRVLRELGFVVEPKSGATGSVDDNSQKGLHTWWVNHSRSFRQELDGSYLWSPKKNKNSSSNESYNNMTRVLPGDIVYSFADAAICAVGIVLGRAHEAIKPAEVAVAGDQWDKVVGWKVPVRFRRLDTPLRPKDHAAELAVVLPEKHSPIRASGDRNPSVYLGSVPPAMADTLRRLLGSQSNTTERKIKESVGPDFLDDIEEGRLQERADLGPAEKEALIRARQGQGRYRQGLETVEIGCRLTGLIDRRHLRASHIKPWCVSNDHEKLDPNNGLLLSPHVDHLFGRGYISFTDEGGLLISRALNPVVLSAWQLRVPTKRKVFSEKQRVYLAYHRNNVFEKHGRGESDEREPNDEACKSDDIVLRDIPTVLDDIDVVLPDK